MRRGSSREIAIHFQRLPSEQKINGATMNIEFREEAPTDIESIYELNHEVFETDAEARLVNALRQANKLVLSMVAVAGNFQDSCRVDLRCSLTT